MEPKLVEDISRDLAVIASRVDRHDSDIVNLTGSLNMLRDRIDYQHQAVVNKLDGLQSSWIQQFHEHSRQDLMKDEQILTKVGQAHETATSLRNYITGMGIGLAVLIPLVSFLVDSGLLKHSL